MKGIVKHLFAGLLLVSLLVSCTHTPTPDGELLISETQLRMNVGDMESLMLLTGGKIIDNNEASWVSTNPEAASVTAGIVEAKSAGKTTIKATYKEMSVQCVVIVESAEDLSAAVCYLRKSSKRGVSYSFNQFPHEDVATLAPFISWCYNWGSQPSSAEISNLLDNAQIEYIPMAWNGVNEAQIRAYKQSHPECEYILAFNEPNLRDQANMTPQQAAEKWPALKNLADELGLKIVSPAMNYGTLAGYSDPVKWLDEFFTLVPKTDMCAIALHCYMAGAGAMYEFIHRFEKYGMPIWMTEFCAWDKPAPGSVSAQIDYMNEAVIMMEAEPMVERYAWFIPRGNGAVDSYPYMQLLSKTDIGALSPQGEVYAGLTSLDKVTWLPSSAPILPNTYSNCSAAESIKNGSYEAAMHLQPTTDNSGVLMMTGFITGKWVEYQIDVVTDVNTMVLRYEGVTGSKLTISVDGEEKTQVSVPWTENRWDTMEIDLPVSAGHHVVRLAVDGHIYYNWFKFVNK